MRSNKLKNTIIMLILVSVLLLCGCSSNKMKSEKCTDVIVDVEQLMEKYSVAQEEESKLQDERESEVQTTKIEQVEIKEPLYMFKRADFMDGIYHSDELEQKYGYYIQSCIRRLFDEDKMLCPSEQECALTLGKIWALFGEPDDPTMYEDFYCYTISAEDQDGNIIYLDIYQYSGMPSIGGPIGEEFKEYEVAALELAELIYKTNPVDYEWKGIYEDYDIYMKYYVKNGVAGGEDNFLTIFD